MIYSFQAFRIIGPAGMKRGLYVEQFGDLGFISASY